MGITITGFFHQSMIIKCDLEDHVVHGMLVTAHAQNSPTRDLVPSPAVLLWRSPYRLTRRINENYHRSHLGMCRDFDVSRRQTDTPGIRRYSAATDDGTTAVSYWPDVAYTPRPHPSLQITFRRPSFTGLFFHSEASDSTFHQAS